MKHILSACFWVCCVTSAAAQEDKTLEQPTHAEVDPIRPQIPEPEGKIDTLAMDHQGRLLVCVSWSIAKPDSETKPGDVPADVPSQPPVIPPANEPVVWQPPERPRQPRGPATKPDWAIPKGPRACKILVYEQDGKLAATWDMQSDIVHMLHCCADGVMYAGTDDQIIKITSEGKVEQRLPFKSILNGEFATADAAGITANDKHVVFAFGYGFSLRATEDVVRFDRDLKNPVVVAKRQYGCCAHIDLDLHGDTVLIAENSRHRVNLFSLDGKEIGRWGQRDRLGMEGFAACCNPVNFDFGDDGLLYTAESGIGRIKKYSADGKFLGLVGYVDTTKFDRGSRLAAMSCYIPIEVGKNADRIFVMDVRANTIRVLQRTTKAVAP